MSELYLSIGGNLGNREKTLIECKAYINQHIGNIEKESSVYESEAWGFSHSNNFYNQALLVETLLSPQETLSKISWIETKMGRTRNAQKEQAYEARIIDIDILLYNKEIITTQSLIIPHPHMSKRNFVMMPMKEIAPKLIHPVLNISMQSLQEQCTDNSKIVKK